MDRADLARRDDQDPLRRLREHFVLPDDVLYLDGNSLGALQTSVSDRVQRVVAVEWGAGLIRSWNEAGWVALPARVAGRLAPLVGADADELTVADSTSANLFKAVVAMARLRPERGVLLADDRNFPTDLYMAGGAAELLGLDLRVVPADDLIAAIDDDVAVVTATEVDYRDGSRRDLRAATDTAHAAGALTVWDLSHSTGAVAVDLHGWGADAAVGCTYKYLNGGPGSPAFLYVARRHHDDAGSPLRGWFGHAEPFAFEPDYRAADGASRFQNGTPSVVALSALDAALEVWDGVDVTAVASRASELTDLFIDLVDDLGSADLEIITPRDPARRGAQVSLRHAEAYRVMRALIAHDVIGDHRPPDVLRFGFSPLYLRRVDVWDAVEHLGAILADGRWRDPAYEGRETVI